MFNGAYGKAQNYNEIKIENGNWKQNWKQKWKHNFLTVVALASRLALTWPQSGVKPIGLKVRIGITTR